MLPARRLLTIPSLAAISRVTSVAAAGASRRAPIEGSGDPGTLDDGVGSGS